MEWALSVVLLGTVAVYLLLFVADARSYAARMEHQRRRCDGLKLLGTSSTTIPEGLVVATIDERPASEVS